MPANGPTVLALGCSGATPAAEPSPISTSTATSEATNESVTTPTASVVAAPSPASVGASATPTPARQSLAKVTQTPVAAGTASPTATGTPAPSPSSSLETATQDAASTSSLTATLAPQPDVRIVCVLFDGPEVRVESDEYVEITHTGNGPQKLSGWRLIDAIQGTPQFVFPWYVLQPGAVIRVYTNQVNAEWGSFSFGHGSGIWKQ